jgi:hypothetical protein
MTATILILIPLPIHLPFSLPYMAGNFFIWKLRKNKEKREEVISKEAKGVRLLLH